MGFAKFRVLIAATVVQLCATAGGVIVGNMFFSSSVALAGSCPNAVSSQGAAVSLPDCRAYEQVTPVDKGDATDLFSSEELYKNPDNGYSSEDGNKFLLVTKASFGASGVSGLNTYVFTRDTQGWTTTGIAPSGEMVQAVAAAVFNPADLSEVGVEDTIGSFGNLFAGNESAFQVAAFIGSPGGPYETVNLSSGIGAFLERVSMVGASADLGHIVLEGTNHKLVPGAASQDAGSEVLYEWVGGQLQMVNVANGSAVSPCGGILGQGSKVTERSIEGGAHGAVSNDGSRIVFTAPDPKAEGPGCWNPTTSPQENPPELYMRIDGTTTREISAPEPGVNDPSGQQPSVYIGASADNSKMFFVTQTELTADDKGHAPELYEYDTEAPEGERLVRVSSGDLESGPAEGNVDFVGAVSSDGSSVYFTAFGRLTPEASVFKEGEGQVNLYRYDTDTRRTTYIAKIGSDDYPVTPGEASNIWYTGTALPTSEGGVNGRSKEVGSDAGANWYTTANGEYLVFATNRDVTGYNSVKAPGVECKNLYTGGASPEDCVELYRYAVGDSHIECVSCGPPGVAQVDNALFARSAYEKDPAGAPPRPISEDGSYVFFDTANALVPQATGGAVHVYEWHEGRISLISSVADPSNAFLLGSSRDGSNVFFGTHAQLLPQDTDVSGDLYDARINGGFPGLAPLACTGTGCQGLPAPPPIFATPASVTFEGVGNFATSSVAPKAKGLTRAQKLERALKACRQIRNRRKRAQCKANARRPYGSRRSASKSKRRGK